MTLAPHLKRVKKERQGFYFDLICGIISSILSLIGIIFVTMKSGIVSPAFFFVGLSFWILYLCFAIFMICLGIYLWYKEKHFEEYEQRRDLKAVRPTSPS